MQEGTMKNLSIRKETTPPWDVFNSLCPTRQVLNRIADKWSVLIIRQLSDGTLRFSQLRRAISGMNSIQPRGIIASIINNQTMIRPQEKTP
jgi:DNA-binding HxlR family transcriptional regulator